MLDKIQTQHLHGTLRIVPRHSGERITVDCSKVYGRPQDLKRHTRDKHLRLRKCPFCCTRWSRPERIRVHLIKKHGSRLTKDQQEEVLSLRGRDVTIRFLANCENMTHPGNYTPD